MGTNKGGNNKEGKNKDQRQGDRGKKSEVGPVGTKKRGGGGRGPANKVKITMVKRPRLRKQSEWG